MVRNVAFIVAVAGASLFLLVGSPDKTEAPVSSVDETPVTVEAQQNSESDKSTDSKDDRTTAVISSPRAVASTTTPSQQKSIESSSPAPEESASFAKEKIEGDDVVSDGKRYPLRTYKTMVLPNDPNANQWWVGATNMEQTWEVPRGSNETLLAIIDTGFALKHEEFQDRWYANTAETGSTLEQNPSKYNCSDRGLTLDKSCNMIDDDGDGIVDNETGATTKENPSQLNCTDQGLTTLDKSCNMIDDDSNGLVDDHRGWDFMNWDNSVQAGEINSGGSGTTHGTLVAGVAAATGNNSKGIAGVDWETKILPIQALDDDSYGHTVSVGRSIRYAASQGADVISLSLGTPYHDQFVRNAVRDAIAAGSIVVAASGNDGCECIVYPANYPEAIAVGALNSSMEPAWFSSWGSNLDIMAPGVSLATTTWSVSNPTSAYDSASGTSLATPVVSGMLTRMLSHQPDASPLQMIAALTENTNRLTISSTTARTNTLGYGALDSHKATQRLLTPYNPTQLYALSTVSNGTLLTPESPAEINKPLRTYQCQLGKTGSTPIYDLTKQSLRLFTASPAEKQRALELGYTTSTLSHSCVQLPHDQPLHIRSLSILREFKNLNDKLFN